MVDVRLQVKRLIAWLRRLDTPENRWSVILCLIVLVVLILTADQAPQWIYQGF